MSLFDALTSTPKELIRFCDRLISTLLRQTAGIRYFPDIRHSDKGLIQQKLSRCKGATLSAIEFPVFIKNKGQLIDIRKNGLAKSNHVYALLQTMLIKASQDSLGVQISRIGRDASSSLSERMSLRYK